MRILEVRDGFIKFETEQNVALSSFIQIDDTKNSYIAQIIQIKHIGETSFVYAKILFLYDGAFNKYDGSLPTTDSEIKNFNLELYAKTFTTDASVSVGCLIGNNENILIDKDCFNKNTLISVDTPDTNTTILKNISKQFNKTLIIDTLGVFSKPNYIAGVDFKLPLNTDALQFLFEDCLNDATSDSKSLIKEIFQDLAEYSKTVPFVPFGALKAIIDEMVDKSHVFKLLVLKNKLAKFDKLGYFAGTVEESENLNKILTSGNSIIDLSKLDPVFQNRYLSIILSSLEKLDPKTQLFVEVANSIDKRNLKKLVTGNLSTTIVTHSKFKYLNEIKPMFKNFIIEPSFNNNQVFKTYSAFLNVMQKPSYLIVGEGTQFIPFVSSVMEIPEVTNIDEPESTEIISADNNEELDQTQIIDLEQALEQDETQFLEENITIRNSSIEAIEKKSEVLIEQVAEEVLSEEITPAINLFEEETDEQEEDLVNTSENYELTEETLEQEVFETEESISEEPLFEDNTLQETEIEEPQSDKEEFELKETDLTEPLEENTIEPITEEFHTQVDEIQTIEIPEDISDLAEEAESIEEIESEERHETEDFTEQQNTSFEEIGLQQLSSETETEIEEVEIINNQDNISEMITISDNEDFDEIIELDESEIDEADIIVDFEDEEQLPLDEEALDKAIVEDVDKVFTTMKEDAISDSDLDFIDELNSEADSEIEEITLSEGMEELTEFQEAEDTEDSFLEPLEEVGNLKENTEEREILEKRNSSTPIVPVYGAEIPPEDMVMSDDIEQGDTVVHAKYGNGIVEKMIKYGTKTLYSINFDNVGRRLLDPTLTEIKKS